MRIAYTGVFKFPTGDAGSARVLGIAEALREAGHEVFFFGYEKEPRREDRQTDGGYRFKGFEYVSPLVRGDSIGARIRRLCSQSTGTLMLERIAHMGFSSFDAVIAYQSSSALLWRLKRLCKRHCVACVCDVVEWYDPRQLWGAGMGPFFWDSELRMRIIQPAIGWIIAISRCLEKYYQNLPGRRCRTIRVPSLFNPQDVCWQHTSSRSPRTALQLVYAGQPGKKDLLGNVLKGVALARNGGLDVVIKLVGVSRHQLQDYLDPFTERLLSVPESGLVLHPRVERTEIPAIVAAADFLPLLRPDMRYAQAGFPTKVVEALSLGVPIIGNLTGDLSLYLKDGYNAFVCEDETPACFAGALERAYLLREKWPDMRNSARRTAEEYFDYRQYVTALSNFMEEAVAEARDGRIELHRE